MVMNNKSPLCNLHIFAEYWCSKCTFCFYSNEMHNSQWKLQMASSFDLFVFICGMINAAMLIKHFEGMIKYILLKTFRWLIVIRRFPTV